MQAILRKISSSDDYSFIARTDAYLRLYDKWHFHPELELTYITHSRGTRFVGDSIEEFEAGDLVLLGANLPHVWKNDDACYAPDSALPATAQVVQFLPDCFGKEFTKLPEFRKIALLMENAKRGIRISGITCRRVVPLLNQLIKSPNGIFRITLLLRILELIAHSDDISVLSSEGFVDNYHRYDAGIINRVYDFTLSNFHRKIFIEEVAQLANMSEASFYRYFKNRTQKTYIAFLTEVRIGYACKLLIENKTGIQQIAFACGFQNLSNFNRSFLALKKQTPLHYRSAFRK